MARTSAGRIKLKSGKGPQSKTTMKVLVIGATGEVGSEVVKALRQRGADVGAARFAAFLGHQPRTYSSFAEELATEWAAA